MGQRDLSRPVFLEIECIAVDHATADIYLLKLRLVYIFSPCFVIHFLRNAGAVSLSVIMPCL